MKKSKTKAALPTPAKIDSRICFSLVYFKTEAEAEAYATDVVQRGCTYNGGWFHGMACGREAQWDYTDAELGKLYAVTE